MQVQRFVAADMRRALEMVRQALGPEAIILSSNRVAEGVELLTTLGSDAQLAQLQGRTEPQLDLTAMPVSPAPSRRAPPASSVNPVASVNPVSAVSAAANRAAQTAASSTPRNPMAQVATHPNAGKTGQQLVAEIEKAHARRMAQQQADHSIKDFLLAQQAKTQAAAAPVVRTLRETRRELRRDMSQVRAPVAVKAAPVKAMQPSEFSHALASASQAQVAAASASHVLAAQASTPAGSPQLAQQSAADRYPLVDVAKLNSAASHAVVQELAPKVRDAVPMPEMEKQLERVMQPKVAAAPNAQLNDLQNEIADMRLLLEEQLARLSDARTEANVARLSPSVASVSRRLERLGLPQDVIAKVTARCKANRSLSETWADALAQLSHQVPVAGEDRVDRGGVFALVGPTGAGKTTTIGKLAARYVLKHGADKVAIITLDNYRIAAHDQLRSLARILRVPVRVVNETQSLESVLESLHHYELVLIDTAGFRHGDARLRKQIQSLSENRQINTLLVMPCNSQAQMLKASVHAYGSAGLKGCILTKLDETASMGEALGVAMQHNLPIVYTTHGQDIPKHIDVAKAHQIVYKAVALLSQQQKMAKHEARG